MIPMKPIREGRFQQCYYMWNRRCLLLPPPILSVRFLFYKSYIRSHSHMRSLSPLSCHCYRLPISLPSLFNLSLSSSIFFLPSTIIISPFFYHSLSFQSQSPLILSLYSLSLSLPLFSSLSILSLFLSPSLSSLFSLSIHLPVLLFRFLTHTYTKYNIYKEEQGMKQKDR